MVKKKDYFVNGSIPVDSKKMVLEGAGAFFVPLPASAVSKSVVSLKSLIIKCRFAIIFLLVCCAILFSVSSYWLVSIIAVPFVLFFLNLSLSKAKFDLVKKDFDENGVF